jgi:S1-C subfamily serine protease
MQATNDSAGGIAECPGCGQEFMVKATRPQLPVVEAYDDSPRAPGPGLRPGTAQPRSQPPAAHPSTNHKEASRKSNATPILLILGSGLLVGGGIVATKLLWPQLLAPSSGAPAPSSDTPAPFISASDALQKIKAQISAAEEQELGDRIRAQAEIKAMVRRTEAEDRLKAQGAREAARRRLASTYFNGDEEVAEAMLQVIDEVNEEASAVLNGHPNGHPIPRTESEFEKLWMKILITRMPRNPTIARWLNQREPQEFARRFWSSGSESDKGLKPPALLASGKYSGMGSGFFISADGWLVTNAHVVKSSKTVDLRSTDGKISLGQVMKVDDAKDLALVKTGMAPAAWLPISQSGKEPDLGQEVFTIGYPEPARQGLEPKFSDGKISSLSGVSDDKDSFQTSISVRHGNSGGPLVDARSGWVIGVTNAVYVNQDRREAETVSYAIKGSILRKFLNDVPEAARAAAKQSPPDLKPVERVRTSSVLVLVKVD